MSNLELSIAVTVEIVTRSAPYTLPALGLAVIGALILRILSHRN